MQHCVYCDVPLDPESVRPAILLEKMAYAIREVTHDGKRKGVILSISGGEPLHFGGRHEDLKAAALSPKC